MNNKIIYLTDKDFNEKLTHINKFILVDFWAEWCNPCKMISSILDEIAEEYYDKLIVAKLNIDENPITAPKYNILSIPTLILFKNNEVIATKVGLISKDKLREFLYKKLV